MTPKKYAQIIQSRRQHLIHATLAMPALIASVIILLENNACEHPLLALSMFALLIASAIPIGAVITDIIECRMNMR